MVVFANIERILQENIFVFRIVFRCGFLIGVGIVDGSFQFHLFRQESTHIHLHSHINIVVFVQFIMLCSNALTTVLLLSPNSEYEI